jgi:hypothetical protein
VTANTTGAAFREPAAHKLHLVKVGRPPGGQVLMAQKLDKVELRELFDRVTKQLKTQTVEVDVASLQLGDQIEADWVRLLGLSYDPHDDAIEIMLDGIDITVPKPREIHFDGTGSRWTALDIRDADGVQHILELKEPLLLPAP